MKLFVFLLLFTVVAIPDPDNALFCPGAVLGEPGGDDGIVNGKCAGAGVCRYTPLSCDGDIVWEHTCICPSKDSSETYFCLETTLEDQESCAKLVSTDLNNRNQFMCPIALPTQGASCNFPENMVCRYSYNDAFCDVTNDLREINDSCECIDGAIQCVAKTVDCLGIEISTCPVVKPLEDQLCNFREDFYCLYGAKVCPEVVNPSEDDIFVEHNCTCTKRTNGESRIACQDTPKTCTGDARITTCPTESSIIAGGNLQCEGRCNYNPFVCRFPGSTPTFSVGCDCLPGPDFGLLCSQTLIICEDLALKPACPAGGFPIFGGICICFPGDATVTTLEKGLMNMEDLEIGDSVLTADNKYERVYSFGHYKQTSSAEYLRFNQFLDISHSHMLQVQGRGFVPASAVKYGEYLIGADGKTYLVETIRTVTGKGMFAPFTPSGTIVVNGFVASTFVSVQGDSAELVIAGISTNLTWQWLAHTFELPHRLLAGTSFVGDETYDENGLSNWVAKPLALAMWLEGQNDVVSVLVWIPILVLVSIFALVDAALIPLVLLGTVVVGAILLK